MTKKLSKPVKTMYIVADLASLTSIEEYEA